MAKTRKSVSDVEKSISSTKGGVKGGSFIASQVSPVKGRSMLSVIAPKASPVIKSTISKVASSRGTSNKGTSSSGSSNSSYGASFYDKQARDYANKVRQDLAQQTAQADANAKSQLQQAYIQRIQNQNALADSLAQAGIQGGVSETATMGLLGQYNANRNTINADRNNQITQLQTDANDNIFNYNQQMATAKAEYLQNREAEKRERQWAIEDAERQRKWQKQDEETQRRIESYDAKYSTYDSVDKVNKSIKSLKAKLKKAKTKSQKAKIRQQITAARNRKGFLMERAYNEKQAKK